VIHPLLFLISLLAGDRQAEMRVLWLIAPNDPLKVAYRRIQVGMPEKKAYALASALAGRALGSGGVEWSAPNWRKHHFAEWFGQGYAIRILSENGRVIEKQFVPCSNGWRDAVLRLVK